jgi:type IV pilus assembly protein PilX
MTVRSQHGAALVIGLILLLVLTLLAISGMNSASVEFIMAGNEQYRQNAFQAAETGIEQALQNGAFVPGGADEPFNGNNTASDTYAATISSPLGNTAQPALWGPANSLEAFSTYHFMIQSVGSSVRGAQSTHLQGVMTLAPADSGTFGGPGGLN